MVRLAVCGFLEIELLLVAFLHFLFDSALRYIVPTCRYGAKRFLGSA